MLPTRCRTGRPGLAAASAAVLCAAALAAPAYAAPAARHLPDLVVAGASASAANITEGADLTVRLTVRNSGAAGAGVSRSRFYLTRDAKGSRHDREHSTTNPRTSPTDILLTGGAAAPALHAHASGKHQHAKVGVPIGTAAGRYSVLACADDTGAVRESDEGDNCTVADTVRVKTAPGTADLQLAEFADSYYYPDPSSGLSYLRYFCSATVEPNHLSPSAALASTEKFLAGTAGKAALGKVTHLAGTAVQAQQLAASALVNGSPGLALAAELRAHDLEPKIGTHLVNAAAIAETVGLPNEALGLLDGAAPLTARRPAMGLSQQAIIDVVRGNALVLTGRPDAAAGLFSAARQAEPLLREADAGLANVTGCKKASATARAYVAAARIRTDEPKDVVIDPGSVPPVKPQLDLTRGVVTPLRQPPAATTPAQGVVQWPVYHQIATGQLLSESQANSTEQSQLQAKLTAADQHITYAEQRRRDGIITLAYQFDTTNKKVLADQAKLHHVYDELTELREGFFGGGTGETKSKYEQLSDDAFAACEGPGHSPDCYDTTLRSTCVPALSATHGTWWQLMGQLHAAAAKWLADTSRGISAYAANLADPVAHRLLLLTIEELEHDQFFGVIQEADFFTHLEYEYSDHCVESDDSQPGTGADAPSAANPGDCPRALKGINLSLDLAGGKLKVNCEQVSFKTSDEVAPLLKAFLDVTYTVRTGSLSVVAGVNGGGKIGGVVDAGFKSGVYITANGLGDITDVGWRVGPSVSVGKGPVNVGSWKDEIDLSFVDALTTGP